MRGKDDDGPFVTRLPSVEEHQTRYLINDELDAKTKEAADLRLILRQQKD